MTPPAAADVLVLSSPDALVSGLPYLIGFPPVESAVLLWLRDRRLLLTQRIDLPGHDGEIAPWLSAMWSHVAAKQSDELVIVMATEREDAGALADRIVSIAVERKICVRDLLVVHDDKWRSLFCDDPSCCNPGGRRIDRQVSDRVAAEFTGVGVSPRPTRESLVRELEQEAEGALRVASALASAVPTRGRAREAWRDVVIGEFAARLSVERSELDVEGAALIIRGLGDVRVRDTILWDLSHADQTSRFRALTLLTACTRWAPSGSVAPASTCAAVAAWLVGDGARAQIALERALSERADYTLALLVQHSIRVGLPPSAWSDSMVGLSREECRFGRASNRARKRAS